MVGVEGLPGQLQGVGAVNSQPPGVGSFNRSHVVCHTLSGPPALDSIDNTHSRAPRLVGQSFVRPASQITFFLGPILSLPPFPFRYIHL